MADCENYGNLYSGNITYARSTCSTTDTRNMRLTATLTGDCGSCGDFQDISGWAADDLAAPGGSDRKGNTVYYPVDGCSGLPAILFGCGSESVTQTQIDMTTTCGDCYPVVGGDVKVNLSNEYTTTQLEEDVDEALAAASWTAYGAGSCTAIFSEDEDELSISKREVDAKLSFAAVPSGCHLSWDIYNGASYVSSGCVNLFAGDTEYVVNIPAPPSPGDSYYVTNAAVVCGSSC